MTNETRAQTLIDCASSQLARHSTSTLGGSQGIVLLLSLLSSRQPIRATLETRERTLMIGPSGRFVVMSSGSCVDGRAAIKSERRDTWGGQLKVSLLMDVLSSSSSSPSVFSSLFRKQTERRNAEQIVVEFSDNNNLIT